MAHVPYYYYTYKSVPGKAWLHVKDKIIGGGGVIFHFLDLLFWGSFEEKVGLPLRGETKVMEWGVMRDLLLFLLVFSAPLSITPFLVLNPTFMANHMNA